MEDGAPECFHFVCGLDGIGDHHLLDIFVSQFYRLGPVPIGYLYLHRCAPLLIF
jgi:hypothetical protein